MSFTAARCASLLRIRRDSRASQARAPNARTRRRALTSASLALVVVGTLASAAVERSEGPFRREELFAALRAGVRALGGTDPRRSPDVLLGHSLGANVEANAIAAGDIAPRLFVAMGARPQPPAPPMRVPYLLGAHDELMGRADLTPLVRHRAPASSSPVARASLQPLTPRSPS